MRMLFESVFLQQGQMGSPSSFFSLEASFPRVLSEEDGNENERGMRFFKLDGEVTAKIIRSWEIRIDVREGVRGDSASASGL
jgi:hypothetical protein